MKNSTLRGLSSIAILSVFALFFVLRTFAGSFGIYAFDALFLFFIAFATYEVVNVKNTNNRGANELVACVVFGLLYLFYILITEVSEAILPWWVTLIFFIVIVGAFALFIWFSNLSDQALMKRSKIEKKDFNKEALGGVVDYFNMLLYPGIVLSCLILINHMVVNNLGLYGLMMVFAISCFTDVMSYVVGVTIGKGTAKMAPKLSPKKTWVGFIGGLFGGILGSLVCLWIMSGNTALSAILVDKWNGVIWVQMIFIVIGIIGALLTIAGDLFASYIKRKNNVKDFGSIIPGHGGIMDRLDGIIFNAPFILLIMGII